MKFKYNLKKEDYNKFLILTQSNTDIFYLSLYTLIYFFLTYYPLKYNFIEIICCYIISIILLYLIISLVKKIYRIVIIKKNEKNNANIYGNYIFEITDEYIRQTVNDDKVTFKYSDIKKIRYKKYYIVIYFKDNKIIYFVKNFIGKNNYIDLVKTLKDNIKKY